MARSTPSVGNTSQDIVGVLPGHLVVAVAGGLQVRFINHGRKVSGTTDTAPQFTGYGR